MLRQCFFCIGLLVLLVGCAPSPQKMGMSPAQWQAMNPEQQQARRDDYEKVQQWQSQAETQMTLYEASPIMVSLQNGKVMMPPFEQAFAFEKADIDLFSGQCKNLKLKNPQSWSSVKIHLCYNGLRLAVDPSRYDFNDREGTLFFYNNPLWQQGFTYENVSSRGYARLQQTDLTIKTIDQAS